MIIKEFQRLAKLQDRKPGFYFEAAVQEIYENVLSDGDVAVDVGANRGRHLFPMARKVGKAGRIIGFEPIEDLFRDLKARRKSTKLKQIRLHRYAAADEGGSASFTYFANRPAFSGLKQRGTPFDPKTEGGVCEISVRKCKLDDKMPWLRKVALIKMDIEGGEYHALKGAIQTMKKSRPIIIFENGCSGTSKTYGYSCDDFFGLFQQANYTVFLIDGRPLTRSFWEKPHGCWEFVAMPTEKKAFAERLPGFCQSVIAENGGSN